MKVWVFVLSKKGKRKAFPFGMWVETGGIRRSWECHFGCVSVKLQAQSLIVKQSSLVDKIIELRVKRSGDIRESLCWSISRYNVLCTVVYSILFMVNWSGTTLNVLFSKDIQMFFSNLSLFYGSHEMKRWLSSRQGGVSRLGQFLTHTCSRRESSQYSFGMWDSIIVWSCSMRFYSGHIQPRAGLRGTACGICCTGHRIPQVLWYRCDIHQRHPLTVEKLDVQPPLIVCPKCLGHLSLVVLYV